MALWDPAKPVSPLDTFGGSMLGQPTDALALARGMNQTEQYDKNLAAIMKASGNVSHTVAPPPIRAVDELAPADPGSNLMTPEAAANAAAAAPQQSAPVVMSAPQYVDPSWSEKNAPVRKEQFDRQKAALMALGKAQNQSLLTQAQGYRAQAEAVDRALDEARAYESDRKTREADRQRQHSEALAEHKRVEEDARKKLNIDPSRWLANPVGFIFGIGLAAAGQGKRVTEEIDREFARQKADAAAAQEGVASHANLLGLMRQRFGDERVADREAQIALTSFAKQKLEGLQLRAKDDQTRAAIGENIATTDAKLADLLAQRDVAMYARGYQVGGGGIAGGNLDKVPGVVKSDAMGKLVEYNGKTYEFPTEPEAREFRKKLTAVQKVESLANQINKGRESASGYMSIGDTPITEAAADLQSAGGQFLGAIKESEDLGALDKGVEALARKDIGDPTALTSRAGRKALKYAGDARRNVDNILKNSGAREVQRANVATPTGTVPTAMYTGRTAQARKPITTEPLK